MMGYMICSRLVLGGSRAVGGVTAPRRPACFQAVYDIISVSLFDGKLLLGRGVSTGGGVLARDAEGTVRSG